MGELSVLVHDDPALLAQAVADRLVVGLLDAQAQRGRAALVLTGGRIASSVYEAVAASPAHDAVDWSQVDLWWGDERFLPAGHAERNDTQARGSLLDRLPLDPQRIHPMPASDGPDGDDPEAAAARYARELAASARPGSELLPHLDVLLLSIGEDGHVASIFPEHPAAYDTRPVSAVRDSPKPPPVRTTLTLPAINTAEQVWVIAAGAEKAGAVNLALTGAGPLQVPAAGVRGVARTVWLLDQAAASELPPRLRSLHGT